MFDKAKWYQDNKERLDAKNRQWAKDNPEKIKAISDRSYKNNIEKKKAYERKFYLENKEKVAAITKKYKEDNPEKVKAGNAKYRMNNKEKIKAADEKWLAKRPSYYADYFSDPKHAEAVRERTKQWSKDNPEKVKAHEAKRRAAKIDAAVPLSRQDKLKINIIYKQAHLLGLHVDHRTPLIACRDCGAKGLHVPDNLALITASENSSKGNRCEDCFTAAKERRKCA